MARPAPLLAAACVLCACKTVYVPNAVNVPLLEHKGDGTGTLGLRNVQVAYAPAEHVGVMGNAYGESSQPHEEDASGQGGFGFLVEGGAGYFTRLPQHLVFETYAGGGFGHVRHDNWETVNGVRQRYSYATDGIKGFVQPSFGIARDFFDAAVSLRFVAIHPLRAESENYPEDRLRADHLFELDRHSWAFLEPTLTLRAGYKWVKAFVQRGYSLKLNDADINRRTNFFYFGLQITFADRFRAPDPH